jgi:hypothetical protein
LPVVEGDGGQPPKRNSRGHLPVEFVPWHVRLVTLTVRDHAPIGVGCCIDDRENGRSIIVATEANVVHRGDPGTAQSR